MKQGISVCLYVFCISREPFVRFTSHFVAEELKKSSVECVAIWTCSTFNNDTF